jgi:hypothetical protein
MSVAGAAVAHCAGLIGNVEVFKAARESVTIVRSNFFISEFWARRAFEPPCGPPRFFERLRGGSALICEGFSECDWGTWIPAQTRVAD